MREPWSGAFRISGAASGRIVGGCRAEFGREPSRREGFRHSLLLPRSIRDDPIDFPPLVVGDAGAGMVGRDRTGMGAPASQHGIQLPFRATVGPEQAVRPPPGRLFPRRSSFDADAAAFFVPSWPRQFPPPGPPADARRMRLKNSRQHQPARPDAHAVSGRPFRLRVRPSTRQLRPGPVLKLLVPGPLDGWGRRSPLPGGPFLFHGSSRSSRSRTLFGNASPNSVSSPLRKTESRAANCPGNGVSRFAFPNGVWERGSPVLQFLHQPLREGCP